MAFKREFLITWDELAPSLQLLFNNLQTQITDNRNEITNLWKDSEKQQEEIDNIKEDVDDIEKDIEDLLDGTSKFYVDGEQGQVVKIDNKQRIVYPHDEYLRLRCVDTDEELQLEMKQLPMNLEDVFYNWYRYAHFSIEGCGFLESGSAETSRDVPGWLAQGQNLNNDEYLYYTDKSRGGWSYNSKEQTIYINGDTYPVAGFINTEDEYTNYLLRIQIHNRADGDNGGIVIGYYVDENGVEHTLSILRGADACYFQYGLVYDAGNPNYKVIWNGQDKIGRGNGYCYLSVQRSDTHFEFKTTNWSSNKPFDSHDVVKSATFTFDLPTSKPTDWSQEMYDNIVKMLNSPNRVGFVVRSGDLGFRIDHESGVFDDDDIYDLKNDIVWTYDFEQSRWIEKDKVHNVLSNRIFIYYERKNYLYFYTYWNTYTKMILNPNEDIINQIKEQIKNIQNNITNIESDITNIENVTNNISNITTSGEQGQVIKINSDNSLFADDNFRSTNIIIDNSELEHILQDINPSLDMKHIFNTWRIILHYDTEAAIYNDYSDRVYLNDGKDTYFSCQNTEISKYNITNGSGDETSEKWLKVLDKSSNSWYYDESNNRIVENFNYSCFSAFIQENNFTNINYYIEFYLNCKDDDDHFCIIFGFMTDDNGIEHTLSFVKAAGCFSAGYDDTYYGYGSSVKVDSRVWSAIVYDFMNPTQQILFDNSKEVGPCDYINIAHYETIVGFRRLNKNSFNIQSSKWSYNDISNRENPEFYEPYTLNVSFPTTKPNKWDDNMWNNIQTMLSSNIFGVGVRSMVCSFNIRNQQGVFPVYDELYYITNGIHYKWNYKTQKFDEYNDIPNRILLYDPFKKKLYFYYYKGNYIEFFN